MATGASSKSNFFSFNDVKPDKFSDDTKASNKFRQWAKDVVVCFRHEQHGYAEMMDLACEVQDVWDQAAFVQACVDKGISESPDGVGIADTNLHDVLRILTEGCARDIVDTHDGEGSHAWWKLHKRFYQKNLSTTQEVCNRLSNIKRPTKDEDVFDALQRVERLFEEYQKYCSTPYPTPMKKSALMASIPESWLRQIQRDTDIDNIEPDKLLGRLHTICSSVSTGPAKMLDQLVKEGDGKVMVQNPQRQTSNQSGRQMTGTIGIGNIHRESMG